MADYSIQLRRTPNEDNNLTNDDTIVKLVNFMFGITDPGITFGVVKEKNGSGKGKSSKNE